MPQQEGVTPKDKLTLLLESIIGDKNSLHILLSQSEAREEILDKASVEIGALDAVETGNLARQILLGLSREDEYAINQAVDVLTSTYLLDKRRWHQILSEWEVKT